MLPISRLRLLAQQVDGSRFTHPQELVGYMGAMQAQDFAMSKWAVGCRVPGSTQAEVEAALDKGEILRTHVMRPTWHLVSAADIHWMLELTAPHIKASMRARNKELELTPAVYAKSHKLLEKLLDTGEHLTRDEILQEYQRVNIATHDNRAAHLLVEAELDGIICSGARRGKSQTYALLSERCLKPKTWLRDEALAELARRYFMSHGPATLADFAWWSGLPAKDTRQALEAIKSLLAHETIDGTAYWWNPSLPTPKKSGIHLLPAFDEFIISYKNRSAALLAEHHARAVSTNGIFRPVIVVDGQVRGLWKRSFPKNQLLLEMEPFESAVTGKGAERAIHRLGEFFGETVRT